MLNKKENWIFYNIYIVMLMVLSVSFRLYADVFENAVYLLIGVYGTLRWYSKAERAAQPSYCGKRLLLGVLAAIPPMVCALYLPLLITDDPLPFLDALSTALGFAATYLMAKRRVEAWIIWLVADIIMVAVYWMIPEQPVYLLALNIVWTALAVLSWVRWHKLSKTQR